MSSAINWAGLYYFCLLAGKQGLMMRKLVLIFVLVIGMMSAHSLMAQVHIKDVPVNDTLNFSRDSLIRLIRIKDSLLHLVRNDSINMSNIIVMLEYDRDSLNSALNQSIYQQKLDSVERLRRYLSYREYNRRTRQNLYNPVGTIDTDSVRSAVKEVIDIVFDDTAFSPKPLVLRSSIERLVNHLANDSVYLSLVNAKQDTVPFVLKKNKVDSAAFFVMNDKNDSAKLFIRSVGKNTIYMWVGQDLMLRHLLKKQTTPDRVGIQWKDPNSLRIARRELPVPKTKLWYLKSELSLMVNQNTFVNWARGGNNNVALTTDVKAWANYAKGSISWTNSFWFVYGVQKTELLSLRKSADRISMVSNLSHKAFKNFDYTLGSTFETQGFKGFAYPNDSIPVSKLMAPADLKISLGLTYKPNPKLMVNVFPLAGQLRFVLDTTLIDQTKYGLKDDQRMNAQLGARVIFNHSAVLFKNVNMVNYLELFSNYIDHPEKVNFIWRLGLQLKVNKYISTSLQTETIYDNRVLVPLYEVQDGKKVKVGEGKRIQFSELFGITFKYTFY